MGFRGHRLAVLSVAVCLSVSAPGAGPADAADPKSADVQWAQTILKDKGFFKGRPNGDMNDPTRAALRAYQKSAGLKQTGQLDHATTSHMLAARQAATAPTMGNLAGPNGRPQPSQAPRGEAPKPVAAPRTQVDSHGTPEGVQALGVVGQSGTAGNSSYTAPAPVRRAAAPGEPVPQAAPRTAVDSIGQAPPEGMREAPDPATSGITVPEWVRTGVIGILAAAFGIAGLTFWLSGRRPSRKRTAAGAAAPAAQRREPSFEGGKAAAGGAPVLRATRPS
ncbi:peptidoglycan-binding protein [Skermanella mucosa]|uniref:peptidoglycan-binding domain-containing protein n=1 Tax=Skermanella mucosa TaxID=1789672 RepID=UPI00192B6087|nr:peptidoglycan-binding domain-containing protein [Skermanella mucosa]UEM20592.1 peptidoglycan-binding protein [Skermanella mucosa]